jgi:Nucleotide-diphospho-sugar transferase
VIAVLSLQFGSLGYFDLSARNHRNYCAKHGVSYFLARGEDYASACAGRHLAWSKLLAARDVLLESKVDAVLYLDADAVFAKGAPAPDQIVAPFFNGKTMLVSEDDYPGVANTGVWCLRNTPQAIALLDYWWSNPGRFSEEWPVEEGAFNEVVLPKFSSLIALASRADCDWVRGSVKHFMAGTEERKLQLLQHEVQ